jgi:hypothetical protein
MTLEEGRELTPAQAKCKQQRREAQARWKAKNPGVAVQRAIEWKQNNVERAKALAKEYRRRNRAKLTEKAREWRKNNNGKHNDINRAWNKRNPEKALAMRQRWKANNPERVKAIQIKSWLKPYGITQEQYIAIFEAQGRRCKICRTDSPTSKRKWQIDHCHDTGQIRGILCHNCNVGLGHFRDNPKFMKAAAAHVEEFRQWQQKAKFVTPQVTEQKVKFVSLTMDTTVVPK